MSRSGTLHHNSVPARILVTLESRPAGVLMRDLAEELGAKRSTVVAALWRLCNRGEVVGRKYEADHRALLWVLA